MTRHFNIPKNQFLSASFPSLSDAEAVPAASKAPIPRSAGTVSFQSRRPHDGAIHAAGAQGANSTRANLIPFPSGSIITAGPTLEPVDLSDSTRNVIALGFLILFVCSLATLFGSFIAIVRSFYG